ncbi:MAG: hypothetical protein JXJ20_08005 [Anaerolineae bacterium]|nr:hypothetical protein [Anaerolineae bacterium]
MSAKWSLAYLKTNANIQDVFGALQHALRTEIDNKVYTRRYHHKFLNLKYPAHIACEVGDDFDIQTVYNRDDPTILLYPEKNGLYTIQFVYFFSPESILMSDRVSRRNIATAIASAEATGDLCQSVSASNMELVAFPRLLSALSVSLEAEIAFVLFVRNPAGEVTSLQFFSAGQPVADYYNSYLDGMGRTLVQPERDVLQDLLDGRFAFVSAPPLEQEDEYSVHFSAEDFGSTTVNPTYTVYDPGVARLFVPFWDKTMNPYGEITYAFQDLFEKSYIVGTAPRPVISALQPLPPACVLRSAPEPGPRRLTLVGQHFPVIHHGLQFRNESTRKLSISFDMEIDWHGTGQISVDMARIKHLLWPDRILRLRVRLMDTRDANYQPISGWSPPFILADDAGACAE